MWTDHARTHQTVLVLRSTILSVGYHCTSSRSRKEGLAAPSTAQTRTRGSSLLLVSRKRGVHMSVESCEGMPRVFVINGSCKGMPRVN